MGFKRNWTYFESLPAMNDWFHLLSLTGQSNYPSLIMGMLRPNHQDRPNAAEVVATLHSIAQENARRRVSVRDYEKTVWEEGPTLARAIQTDILDIQAEFAALQKKEYHDEVLQLMTKLGSCSNDHSARKTHHQRTRDWLVNLADFKMRTPNSIFRLQGIRQSSFHLLLLIF